MDEFEKDKSQLEISITKEMKTSFIDYAMSVILSRAIPDARDGLKPVHRRILFAMHELEMFYNKPFKKSARVVGEVLAKYHPHGDSSVYDAIVRMAQDFSLRYPLIWGQGNFGSIDGDSAAAMRYTEVKLQKITNLLLEDLNKNVVEFVENYDGNEVEPTVLPTKLPLLLLNGSTGIAVGMSTSIPPHNLSEVINVILKYIENNDVSFEELLELMPGPDFPTGGTIINRSWMLNLYKTGRGKVILRAKVDIEEISGESSKLIIKEIPYTVIKKTLIEDILKLIRDKKIESISDIVDESNREGMRVVISLKKGYSLEVELNKLYRMTNLKLSFPVNMIAINNQRPETLDLKKIIKIYVDFQLENLIKRTKFLLEKALARKHILEGLNKALQNIDAIIELIKKSNDTKTAIEELKNKYELSEEQAKAILDMKLQRLTGLERKNLQEEIEKLNLEINNFNEILDSEKVRLTNISNVLKLVVDEFADKRKTMISEVDLLDIDDEDLIPKKTIIVSLTQKGYIKRIPIEEYRVQSRGGIGFKSISTYDDDYVNSILVTGTHNDLLFFTSLGRVFKLRGHTIPEMEKNSKGRPIINLLDLKENEDGKKESIKALMTIEKYEDYDFIFFTKKGIVKKTTALEFERVQRNGKIAINLNEDDELLGVAKVNKIDESSIIIGSSSGKAIQFSTKNVRNTGRASSGVKGMKIEKDHIVGFGISQTGNKVFVLSEFGFAKLTPIDEYRITKRGAKGVKTINLEKAGALTALKTVNGDEDIIVITNKGTTIRTSLNQISVLSRNTKGVKLINLQGNEKITSVAIAPSEEIINSDIEKTKEQDI